MSLALPKLSTIERKKAGAEVGRKSQNGGKSKPNIQNSLDKNNFVVSKFGNEGKNYQKEMDCFCYK